MKTDCEHFVLDECVCYDFGEPKGQCGNCGAKDSDHKRSAFSMPGSVQVTITIDRCVNQFGYSRCPHYGIDGGPEGIGLCNHPKFEGCKPYENAIIGSYGPAFPEKCPLMIWNQLGILE